MGMLGEVCSTVAVLAATAFSLQTRQAKAILRLQARQAEFRERELRFGAHALFAAARISPQTVIESLDRAARLLAPQIDGALFIEVDAEMLTVVWAQGMHAEYLHHARLEASGASIAAHAYRLAHRVVAPASGVELFPGERCALAVPLIDGGRVIAIAVYSSRTSDVIAEHDALVTLIELGVSAYALAHERRADIESATIDALTGLLTPRAFRQRLSDDIADARMMRRMRSLLFFDTDNFKACNDTYGHAAGDLVLAIIAKILRSEGGPDAIVGRNGGDEFCLLLKGGKTAALRCAERIRLAVQDYPYDQALGITPARPITASIGVAAFPDDATDAKMLLERADAAMYYSKRSGRNCVALALDADRIVTLAQAAQLPA